jgi:hypothetical protein
LLYGVENKDKFKSLRKKNQRTIRLKSKIKMDKHKLIQIIVKDLEELKFLSEEVADIEGDATLIVELALSKARLLCQEIEVLRELSVPKGTIRETEEVAEIPEPELEILKFDDRSLSEEDEENDMDQTIDEIEEDEEEVEELPNEIEEEEEEEVELNEEPDFEEDEEFELTEDPEEQETIITEEDDDDLDEEEDDLLEEDELEEEIEEEELSVEYTELKTDNKPEYREINIDDTDDDDLETIHFSPQSANSGKSAMHEIPKPENQEKTVIGETFQKERSVNDVMSEKSAESKLTNGPIASLRAAIGLNDRFLFIREIFDNNTEKYNTVIENLDKLETIQQAVEYLKAQLSLQKNETSLKFVELLKRRFSK